MRSLALVVAVALASCRESPAAGDVEDAAVAAREGRAGADVTPDASVPPDASLQPDAGVTPDTVADTTPPREVLASAPWRLEVGSTSHHGVTTIETARSNGEVSETTEWKRLVAPAGMIGVLDMIDRKAGTKKSPSPPKPPQPATWKKESAKKLCPTTPAWMAEKLDRSVRAWMMFLAAPRPVSAAPDGVICPDCGSLSASVCASLPEGGDWCRSWSGEVAFGFMRGPDKPPPPPTERQLEMQRLRSEMYGALAIAMEYARNDCFDPRAVLTRKKWKAFFQYRRDRARALRELAVTEAVHAAATPEERGLIGYGDVRLIQRVVRTSRPLEQLSFAADDAARKRAGLELREVVELSKWDSFFCEVRNQQLNTWACTPEGEEALGKGKRCETFGPTWGMRGSMEESGVQRLPARFGEEAVALVRELEPDFLAMMETWSECGCAQRLDQRLVCAPASTPIKH